MNRGVGGSNVPPRDAAMGKVLLEMSVAVEGYAAGPDMMAV
jgi:hypothetical protein